MRRVFYSSHTRLMFTNHSSLLFTNDQPIIYQRLQPIVYQRLQPIVYQRPAYCLPTTPADCLPYVNMAYCLQAGTISTTGFSYFTRNMDSGVFALGALQSNIYCERRYINFEIRYDMIKQKINKL